MTDDQPVAAARDPTGYPSVAGTIQCNAYMMNNVIAQVEDRAAAWEFSMTLAAAAAFSPLCKLCKRQLSDMSTKELE